MLPSSANHCLPPVNEIILRWVENMIRSLPYTKNLLLTRLQKYYLSCFLILMYHYWTFKSWYLVRSFIYKLVKNYFCTQVCRIRPEQLCQGICFYISKNIERLKNTLRKRKEAQSWFKISFELFMFFWCRVTHSLTDWTRTLSPYSSTFPVVPYDKSHESCSWIC